MGKNLFIQSFAIANVLFSFAPLALGKDAGTINKAKCALSKTDKYELPTLISTDSKKFSGQCIDSKRFRPAVIISQKKSKNLIFQNYLHENKYWKATLPKNIKVSDVHVHVVRFSVVSGVTAAHIQLRAKLADNIKLKSGDEETEVNDIVVSFEAARPKGISYNFALGVVDNYLLVGRVASGQQRLDEYGEGYYTEQYRLNLSAEESSELLFSALKRSHDSKFKRFYNTLKPNCTTEIFDLIDQLPSQIAKSNEPFLTVISNDPVAGPTIEGLIERNILDRRYSNLNDELESGSTKAPKEKAKTETVNLLPNIKGYPYALILAAPDENLSNKETIKKAKTLTYKMAPQLIQRLASRLMLSGVDASSSLLGSLKDLSPLLKEQLKSINKDLTDEPLNLALYLSPWDVTLGEKVDVMKELDIPARLPFKTFETNINDIISLNEIHTGLNDAALAHAEASTPYGFMGLAIQLHLVKDHSKISLQAVGQIGALKKEMSIINDQVQITDFEVPNSLASHLVPTVVINLSQGMNDTVPNLNLSFGNFGGVYQGDDLSKLGQLSIKADKEKTDEICFDRRSSTPKLIGKAVVKGKTVPIKVLLDIFSIDFDLDKQIVSAMDMRVSTGFGLIKNCASDPSVNLEFTNTANAKIKDQKEKLEKSPGLAVLNQILSNNESGKISGSETKKD